MKEVLPSTAGQLQSHQSPLSSNLFIIRKTTQCIHIFDRMFLGVEWNPFCRPGFTSRCNAELFGRTWTTSIPRILNLQLNAMCLHTFNIDWNLWNFTMNEISLKYGRTLAISNLITFKSLHDIKKKMTICIHTLSTDQIKRKPLSKLFTLFSRMGLYGNIRATQIPRTLKLPYNVLAPSELSRATSKAS